MSISEWRCRELRRLADKLGNKEEISVPFVRVLVIPIMREAADTIECLRDRLQLVPAELDCIEDKSRWYELFGTPERAARTLENGTPLCGWCDTQTCDKRGGECSLLDYDVLLEWLRGDFE
jgi:hypothetical protein